MVRRFINPSTIQISKLKNKKNILITQPKAEGTDTAVGHGVSSAPRSCQALGP
jgi:hypothetical protein